MDQDIIEKKPASPMATSLLAITACCMLGAMIVCGMELHELKHGDTDAQTSAQKYAKEKFAKFEKVKKSIPQPEDD